MCKVNRLIKQVVITVEQCYNEGDALQEHITLSMGKSNVSGERLPAAAWLGLQVQQKLALIIPCFFLQLHYTCSLSPSHTPTCIYFFQIKGRVISAFLLEANWCQSF